MAHPMTRTDFRLQAQAILAIRHARSLAEHLAQLPDPPIGDLPRSTLDAALRRLESGDVTDGRDRVVLEVLQTGFAERMAAEVNGSTLKPRHAGYDEEGDVWVWETVPTYTSRGETACILHMHLTRLLELRQDLLDRCAAERLTARLMR